MAGAALALAALGVGVAASLPSSSQLGVGHLGGYPPAAVDEFLEACDASGAASTTCDRLLACVTQHVTYRAWVPIAEAAATEGLVAAMAADAVAGDCLPG